MKQQTKTIKAKKRLITSAPQNKIVSLNKVSWKNRILAGLVDFDQLLLSVKIITRVEGSYVVFKFQITKDNTLFTLKLRLRTFRALFAKLQKIAQEIDKTSKSNY